MVTLNYHGRKIRLTKEMQGYLEYALNSPTRWHDIGHDEEGTAAVKRLEKIGLVEIREYSNQYKINPKF